jgi:hypothetical protein
MTDSLPHDRSPSCDKETKNTKCTFSRIRNVGAQISTNLKEIVSIGEAISQIEIQLIIMGNIQMSEDNLM